MSARDVQPFDNAEVCEPQDSTFTGAQYAAVNDAVKKHPNRYVWISIDTPTNFIVDSARYRADAQRLIFDQSAGYRVWVVQYGAEAKGDSYEPPKDNAVNRRRRKFTG